MNSQTSILVSVAINMEVCVREGGGGGREKGKVGSI